MRASQVEPVLPAPKIQTTLSCGIGPSTGLTCLLCYFHVRLPQRARLSGVRFFLRHGRGRLVGLSFRYATRFRNPSLEELLAVVDGALPRMPYG